MPKSILFKTLFFPIILLIWKNSYSQSGSIQTIYFKKNSSVIEEPYKPILKEIASQIKTDTSAYLKIFGYADPSGTEAYNEWLSEKRTNAVLDFLKQHVRMNKSKIYVTWIGESSDVYDLHLPSPNFQKRCVDIWLSFGLRPNN